MCGIFFYDNFCDQILGKFFQDDPMCHFNCVMRCSQEFTTKHSNDIGVLYRCFIYVSKNSSRQRKLAR